MTYANWFSYQSAGFASENREIYRSIRITRALFPHAPLRFVADDGPYVLLAGLRAVLVTAATLAFSTHHPFPRAGEICG